MQLTSLLGGLALLNLAAAAPVDEPEPALEMMKRQVPVRPCSTGVHVIAAGGRGTANPKDYGLLRSLSQSILNAIPDSTNVSLPYDKLNTRTNPNAIPDGINTLVQYVNDYHRACPNTRQVLIGYSSGAIITMSGICEGRLPRGLGIDSIVVYGDQTRNAAQPFQRGTCVGGSGRSPRGIGGCAAYKADIQSYCDAGDPECCTPNQGDPNIHFSYPGKYDQRATQFIVNKFRS